MPSYDKVLELAEVLKFDSDNTIKKVTLNVKTYDVAVGSSVYAVQPMVAVLSAEDLANSEIEKVSTANTCLLYTSPSPRDGLLSRMPSSA